VTADCLISRKRIGILAAYGREGPPDFINRLVFVDDTTEPLAPKVGDACHAALSAAIEATYEATPKPAPVGKAIALDLSIKRKDGPKESPSAQTRAARSLAFLRPPTE
jgi:hypothetical protein